MIRSTLHVDGGAPLHVAIIMDGSGRWATQRGLARSAGHREGVEAVRRVIQAAPGLDIVTLTLDAFSSDNWQRPAEEVGELLRIFREFFETERAAWVERGVRVSVLGRRDRLPRDLLAAFREAEEATAGGRVLDLRLAIDYSGREAILRAAKRLKGGGAASTTGEFSRLLAQGAPGERAAPDVDLLIRTGGERRLSNFMLWEIAYAELLFSPRLWPDFGVADLEAAVREFHSRERRFGRLPQAAAV